MSERKYRQRGYQDDGGNRPRERRSGDRPGPGPRRPGAGPRGRGLGKPTATVFRCAVCGYRQESSSVAFDATCVKCGTDLHTCTHCCFFDPTVHNECREPITEAVRGKAKRNECELFMAKAAKEFAPDTGGGSKDPRAAFDALFRNL